jgi:hypothetical protein
MIPSAVSNAAVRLIICRFYIENEPQILGLFVVCIALTQPSRRGAVRSEKAIRRLVEIGLKAKVSK